MWFIIILLVLVFLTSYLLGSIPFALIIGKVFYKTDVRNYGSGNLGTTNTFRSLGKKAGIAVLLGDILKGTLSAFLPYLLNANIHPLIVGFAAIIGHSYPIFAKFKGGKSVATSAGVILAVSPVPFALGVLSFLLMLKISKYVSLSSTFGALCILISSLFTGDNLFIVFSAIMFPFIAYKHRHNFTRIRLGNEPKAQWL